MCGLLGGVSVEGQQGMREVWEGAEHARRQRNLGPPWEITHTYKTTISLPPSPSLGWAQRIPGCKVGISLNGKTLWKQEKGGS